MIKIVIIFTPLMLWLICATLAVKHSNTLALYSFARLSTDEPVRKIPDPPDQFPWRKKRAIQADSPWPRGDVRLRPNRL